MLIQFLSSWLRRVSDLNWVCLLVHLKLLSVGSLLEKFSRHLLVDLEGRVGLDLVCCLELLAASVIVTLDEGTRKV